MVGPLRRTAIWIYAIAQLPAVLIYPSQHEADCAVTAAAHYHCLTYGTVDEAL